MSAISHPALSCDSTIQTQTESPNPYVFIVGCPRSGTTLLERMVNAHPQIAIIHESHWITRFFKKRIGVTRDGVVTPDIVSALCDYHRFHLLDTHREFIEQLVDDPEPITYSKFVSRIFDQFGSRRGKRYVGDKTTGGYLRNLNILHSLWPAARLVHLIRDGRSNCLSMINWPKSQKAAARFEIWKEDKIATVALWWKWHIQRGKASAADIAPKQYYEMRYESLVENPEQQCRNLCRFLDLPYDDAMLRFNEGRETADAGQSANRGWRSPTKGLRNWRNEMPARDVEMFEAIAGDVLEELGYDREYPTISRNIAMQAKYFQEWWNNKQG